MKTLFPLLITLVAGLVDVAGAAPAAVPASRPAQASVSAAGNSFNPLFSADGQHLVFVSHANNLVTNDNLNPWLDVFVHDLVNSNTVLVSVDTSGLGGANADANYPSISSNGQFIAFASRAGNLVAGDTNSASDIFVRDVVAGTTRLVSVEANGGAPADPAPSSIIPLTGNPMISAEGRWVIFESRATNLVAGGAPLGGVNIYARDTWSNVTVLVTADANGLPVGGKCELTDMTPDGRYTLFIATNGGLASYDHSGVRSLYLRDYLLATTELIHSNPEMPCVTAVIAAHGTNIVFSTQSTSAPGSSNMVVRFTRSLVGGGGRPLSIFATNTTLSMSADGTRVAFEAGGQAQLWIFHPNIEAYARPVFLTNASARPLLSGDGQSLVFVEATTPTATSWQIHAQRQVTNYALISASSPGGSSAGDFFFSAVAVSPDGSRVAFDSTANDLVVGDRNGASDIFLRDINTGVTELISSGASTKPAATAFAHSFLEPNSISADGRFVVSTRYDEPSAYRDTNGWTDVYVTDLWSNSTVAVSVNATGVGNTNLFKNPILSGDGTTIVATRGVGGSGESVLFSVQSSNGVFTPDGLSSLIPGSSSDRSYAPSLSASGQTIVFTTTSSTVVEGFPDDNGWADVILRRVPAGTNIASNYFISVTLAGNSGSGASSNGFLSRDERWVIFESTANNLTTNNAAGLPSLYARDWQSNVTYLVSVAPNGNPQWGCQSASAVLSGNSRYVAFPSGNNYLTVHDLLTHTSVLADNPVAKSPALDYDGRLVAYVKRSAGSNYDQVYVRDLQGTQIDLVSANVSGAAGHGHSSLPLLSGDGRYVVFASLAGDLVANDVNGVTDIFVRDRVLGVTMVVSANAQGRPGNGSSTRPVLAADGRTVVFQSFANDLVGGDYNDKRDLFVVKLGGADTDHDEMDDDWEVTYFGNLSRNGVGDYDNDGATDLAEFRAGTDPTNSNSVFRVLTVAPAGGGNTLLLWTGNAALTYRAEFKDDLGAASWTPLAGTISWNGTTASIPDVTAANSTHRYYRVVRLP